MQKDFYQEDMAVSDRALVGAFLPNQQGRVELCNHGEHSSICKRIVEETDAWLATLPTPSKEN